MVLRPASLDDAQAIREIYNAEVTGSTATFDLVPRSLEEQREWISARTGAHAVVVAEVGGEVVGFASLSPYRDRAAYRTTVEDSVYVRSDQRGNGVGRALLAELVRLATSHGFHTIIARIAGGQEASVALHRSVGFEVVGVERQVGRKFRTWLDATVMQLML